MNLFVSLKDGVCGSYELRQFGVGEDSIVGINFQTVSQDHWRGGLQGLWLSLSFSLSHSTAQSFINKINDKKLLIENLLYSVYILTIFFWLVCLLWLEIQPPILVFTVT